MAQIPPALLGDNPTAVTAKMLGNLLGYEEGQHLELKTEVGDAKSERREFALDVAALANGGGGLLAVGIGDDDTGAATLIAGISSEGDTALRFEQILASLVQPPMPMTVGRVPLDETREVILIAVEGGPLRPHAVMDGTSRVSYPTRRGRKKEYLTEPEIADSYARRFASAAARADELAALHFAFSTSLPTQIQAWFALTVMPSAPGFGSIRSDLVTETKGWLNALDRSDYTYYWNTRVGYRAVLAADDFATPTQQALLRVDGAGAAAWSGLTYWRDGDEYSNSPIDGEPTRFMRNVTAALEKTFESLLILANHAHRSGATGTADVALQLVTSPTGIVQLLGAGQSSDRLRTYNQPVELIGSSRVTLRTIDLAALPNDPEALLATAALLSIDLVSEYGYADLGVVDEAGRIVARAAEPYTPALYQWAQQHRLLDN